MSFLEAIFVLCCDFYFMSFILFFSHRVSSTSTWGLWFFFSFSKWLSIAPLRGSERAAFQSHRWLDGRINSLYVRSVRCGVAVVLTSSKDAKSWSWSSWAHLHLIQALFDIRFFFKYKRHVVSSNRVLVYLWNLKWITNKTGSGIQNTQPTSVLVLQIILWRSSP